MLGVVATHRYYISVKDIPGPFVVSFSVWWQLYHIIVKSDYATEIVKRHRKHGNFVRIPLNEIGVLHPDAVREVLMTQWWKTSCLASQVDPKRRMEMWRTVGQGYMMQNIGKSEPYIDNCVIFLERQLDNAALLGEAVHFDEWFVFYSSTLLVKLRFHPRSVISSVDLRIQPNAKIMAISTPIVQARRENHKPRKDMMTEWLSMRSKPPEKMKDSRIDDAALLNIVAGAEAFFYWLLRAPRHLEKLRAEINEAQAKMLLSPVECIGSFLKVAVLSAAGISRKGKLANPAVLPSLTIPWTVLSINAYATHRNPIIIGPDSTLIRDFEFGQIDPAREWKQPQGFNVYAT
ncbi:cytochrome P450 [Zopfia rhizophila CBS 207.26]|uniref:Cytochrome P450 n=1 Tax=Zopfia rhizophila CBS 207.26 TaxID=1314779 RepID=A0A6A6E4M7_9PEZI|nr:cytochrome P450 [Zopfia rhizophila CBS 207.26]